MKRLNGLFLFHKLMILVFVSLVVISALLISVFVYFSKESTAKHVVERLQQEFSGNSDHFDNQLRANLVKDLRLLAANPSLDEFIMSNKMEKNITARAVEKLFLENVNYTQSYKGIRFINSFGIESIKVSRAGRHRDYQDIGDSTIFTKLENVEAGGLVVDDIIVDGQKGMEFSIGISKIDPDIGEFGGAVIIDLSLNEFIQSIGSLKIFSENLFWVLAADGKVVLRPRHTNNDFDLRPFLPESFQALPIIQKTDNGILMYEDLAIIQGSPVMRIAISMPDSLMFRDLYATLKLLYALCGFSLILISIPAFFFSKQISGPITRLAHAAARIGKGDLGARLDIRTGGEVKILVDSFNQMTENLEKTTVSHDYVDSIINTMGNALIVLNPKGIIEKINTRTELITGYQAEELIGRSLNIIAAKEFDGEHEQNGFSGDMPEKGYWNIEKYCQTKNGDSVPTLFSSTPMLDSNKEIKMIVCVFQDISGRKKMEEALKDSEDHFRSLIESSQDCITNLSLAGIVLSVNPKGFELNDIEKPADMIDKPCDFFIRENKKELTEAVKRAAQDENVSVQFMTATPKERIIWWDSKLTPLKDIEGEIKSIMMVSRDITAMKSMHDELEKAYAELKNTQSQMLQREKMASIGQLAAGVAHEINNPMGFIASNLSSLGKYTEKLNTYITAQSDLLEATNSPEERKKLAALTRKLKVDFILEDIPELLAESLDGAERVKSIVQNLKGFSRLDEVEIKMSDIHECLESTLNIVWNEIKYKASVVKEYGEIPLTSCNPQQLNQVFLNMLINASHSFDEHGEIKIKTWATGETIYVSFADNGCGIAADKVSRIFEPFFTSKEVGKGTGLGLSISYDIIKKHNGKIQVTSEVGKGTDFIISIPVVEK